MELSEQSIHDVIHPTAAFVAWEGNSGSHDKKVSWEQSVLNPKNRIDSLDVLERPLWRIDGCTAFGSQFYAIPLYMEPLAPLRVDVFIPEPASLSSELKDLLDVDVIFHTRDSRRISHLGITRHLLRILQQWTLKESFSADAYKGLPFGSRIVLRNLPMRIDEAEISIVRTHHLERQLLSLSALEKAWPDVPHWPRTIDIHDMEYVSQIHDSVCLVKFEGQTWIFKAITSYTKYLYHELGNLLRISPHQNVVARPVHVVTKTCTFGGKVAVVGLTLEFHSRGSVRDLIPFMHLHGLTTLADEAKWSFQIASALLHLRETTGTFYPDLRLDNLVLADSGDIVMVDFEQRGVWCEFAAPEVNAIEYIRILAVDQEIPSNIQAKYANILSDLLPNWEDMFYGEDYVIPSEGYNIPWACLTPAEHEACEVYMLGRVLWCIFEARSAPQRAAVWLSYRWEPSEEFPTYTRTPQPMRELIDRCTRGRQPGLTRFIVREQNKLVLREHENTNHSTARQVQETARYWWKKEVELSERWLEDRSAGMQNGTWNHNYYDRPSLKEVHDAIKKFCCENGFVV